MLPPPADDVSTAREPFPVPGGWQVQGVQLGSRDISLWLPADPDAVLEKTGDEGDPYWAALWTAALPLARTVLRRAPWPRGSRLLELGCGAGLVGLAALLRGDQVTFSDHQPLALQLARVNARRNGFPACPTLALDWRCPPPSLDRYDALLASDVLYDADAQQPLLHTARRLLPPAGLLWIGDPGRCAAERFLERAAAAGWKSVLFDEQGRKLSGPAFGRFQLIQLRAP